MNRHYAAEPRNFVASIHNEQVAAVNRTIISVAGYLAVALNQHPSSSGYTNGLAERNTTYQRPQYILEAKPRSIYLMTS